MSAYHDTDNDRAESMIHETAIVESGAIIGEGTKVWHHAHIMSGAQIGKNCVISKNVFIAGNVIIGDNTKIQNNVSVYSGVTIWDNVFIGPSVVFTNVKKPRAWKKQEYEKTLIKSGVTIGANSTIICGIEIGEKAFIGAGSVVTKNVDDLAIVLGNPARKVGYVEE